MTFPKLEQEEEKYRKPVSSSSSSHCSPLYEGQKGDIFEQKVIFSGFGSIMRFSTSAVSQQRGRDTSPVDYKASNPVSGPSGGGGSSGNGGSSSHKRMPSLSIEDGEVLKEKKHKASKKNKHGPGRPKGGKSKEVLGAQLAGSTATSASPFSGGSLVSASIGNSSRSFSHTGSLPSLSLESPLLGSGMFPAGSHLLVLPVHCTKQMSPFLTKAFGCCPNLLQFQVFLLLACYALNLLWVSSHLPGHRVHALESIPRSRAGFLSWELCCKSIPSGHFTHCLHRCHKT